MLRWARCGFHKKHAGTHYTKLVFLHPMGSVGHIVYSGASGPQNVSAVFFMLWWARCGLCKKPIGTRDAELVLLHRRDLRVMYCIPMCPGRETSMQYFSCSGGPDAVSIRSVSRSVTLNLCFCIWWDLRVMQCLLVRLGCETLTHYFLCSGETGTNSTKSMPRAQSATL
jgi:hypothetical protein